MLNDTPVDSGLTLTDAERFIRNHRRLLKHWTLTSAGFRDGDDAAMRAELEANLPVLANIAVQYPQHAVAIGLLTDALSQGDKSGDAPRPRW